MCHLCFFFFKQKTAYEMRISDWSSDVCSSDLGDIRMSATILVWALVVAQVFLTVAMGCAAYRLLIGPRAQDRILGLDTLYINAMLLLLTFGIRRSEEHTSELQSLMRISYAVSYLKTKTDSLP